MNTALEYSTRVVQEGGRRCKKSTLNDLVHLTPLRIPLMNPPPLFRKSQLRVLRSSLTNGTTRKESNDGSRVWSISGLRSLRTNVHLYHVCVYKPLTPHILYTVQHLVLRSFTLLTVNSKSLSAHCSDDILPY